MFVKCRIPFQLIEDNECHSQKSARTTPLTQHVRRNSSDFSRSSVAASRTHSCGYINLPQLFDIRGNSSTSKGRWWQGNLPRLSHPTTSPQDIYHHAESLNPHLDELNGTAEILWSIINLPKKSFTYFVVCLAATALVRWHGPSSSHVTATQPRTERSALTVWGNTSP